MAFNTQHIIDFFPGIDDTIRADVNDYTFAPSRVGTAQMYRLGTRGGVLVSGRRTLVSRNSTHFVTTTSWIAVEAANTKSIVVRTNMRRPLKTTTDSTSTIVLHELGDGQLVQIDGLNEGETLVLFSSLTSPPPNLTIEPAKGCPEEYNYWPKTKEARNGGQEIGYTGRWPCLK